jgi:hypothetical protein
LLGFWKVIRSTTPRSSRVGGVAGSGALAGCSMLGCSWRVVEEKDSARWSGAGALVVDVLSSFHGKNVEEH